MIGHAIVRGLMLAAPPDSMPAWARCLAPVSPLSYAADLIRRGYGQEGYFPPWLDAAALVVFAGLLWLAALWFHRRTRARGL